MGASNVSKVFEHWNHLDHRNARGLAYMANVSMDGDTPPVYWGGWESLAKAVGQSTADKPETARRTAVRVLSALCKAGALVSSGQARPGVRAEYAVTLDPDHTFKPVGKGKEISWTKVERTLEPETASVPRVGTPTVPPPETASVPRVGTPTVPPPETASVPPPETPTVSTWDSYGPEPETARCTPRNNSQEQHKEQLEEKQIGKQASGDVKSPPEGPDEAPLLDEEIPIDDPEAPQTMGNDMPTSWDEEIDDYEEASKYLQGLPDVGQSHMQAVNASTPDAPLRARVIAAANNAGWNQQEMRKAS